MRAVLISILIFFYITAYKAQTPILDSLKTELQKAKHDTTRCNLLYQMIEAESDDEIWPGYNNQLQSIAEKNLKKINDTFLQKKFKNHLADAFFNMGYYETQNGNFNKAIQYYYQCIQLLEQIQDKKGVALSYISIGNLYKLKGDYNLSLSYYQKSLKINEDLKDEKGISASLFYIGFSYDNLNNIPLALEYYHKSLKIREKIKDIEGIASCQNNIATLHEAQGNYDKALINYKNNIRLFTSISDKYGMGTTLNNMGLVYIKQRKLDDAILKYQESLKIFTEIGDESGISSSYGNTGFAYFLHKNYVKALEYYFKSLEIKMKLKNNPAISSNLCQIGKIYLEQGNVIEAKNYGIRSLKIAKQIDSPEKLRDASGLLSKIYENQNQLDSAFVMHKLYIAMRDSTNNISNQKALITQNTKYEYEKKAAADSVKVFEEKKVINAQLKQEKTQRFALYGGLILVALFGVFMFNRFKVTQKQNHIIQIQKSELQHQKEIVDEKQKEMLDSIHYAKRIQNALIANTEFINKHLENNFIYFNPKDIVSGDFYWATHYNNKFYLAVCDSTGHGVPGAFMSLLNIGFLSEAIKEKNITKPHEVLNYVRQRLINTMSNEGQKDGMDGILICYDKESNTLEYAAANNAPILIRNNGIVELAKDKMPIGQGEKIDSFTLHTVSLQKGDALYLYTDGFADQFGGPESGKGGKKYKYKPLNNLLVQNTNLPLSEQSAILQSVFNNWKGNLEQVDDVLVIGVKI